VPHSKIISDLSSKANLPEGLFSIEDEVIFSDIIEQIPNKKALLTQILFSFDQMCELIKLTSEHHKGTGFHLGRVGRLGAILAQKVGLPWNDQLECLYGGWIHDIGKMYIPTQVLDKPGRLTTQEYELIKLHVNFGCDLVRYYPHLRPYVVPVRSHHERYDGNGYPDKLSKKEIPITGAITGIVDAYDAMTNFRPYSPHCRSHEEAITELIRCRGGHFDGELVDIFCEIPVGQIKSLCKEIA